MPVGFQRRRLSAGRQPRAASHAPAVVAVNVAEPDFSAGMTTREDSRRVMRASLDGDVSVSRQATPRSTRNARGRRMSFLVVLGIVAGITAGCGDDDPDAASTKPAEHAAFLTLTEVESVIEQGETAVVRTGGADDPPLRDDVPPLLEATRYASQSGEEFDVLVFASHDDAKRARRSLVDREDDAAAVRAANVVAVFPGEIADVDVYRAAAEAMNRLRTACKPGGAGDGRLRRLCFDPDDVGAAPEGEGVDRDEAAERERPVVVDGLRYDPLLARRLNPRIVPDEGLLSGRLPSDQQQWFGVFLRVCNDSDRTRATSSRLALVDADGARVEVSDALPASNPFAYHATAVEPEDCIPKSGSVAERVSDGALVLFEVPEDFLMNRPVALEITGESGERKRSIVDV